MGPIKVFGSQVLGQSHTQSQNQNVFENLSYGIHYRQVSSVPVNTTISRNIFTNVSRSVFLSNADYSVVTLNEVEAGPYLPVGLGTLPYGIYLEGCDGYQVQENTITENVDIINYGIYVNRTGSNSNRVYKNYINDMLASLLASETNDNTQFLCNEMNDAAYHIAVFEGGTIRDNQGGCDIQFGLRPAGNIFSTCNTSLTYAHLYNHDNNALITYHYEPTSNQVPTSGCASPQFDLDDCTDIASSCPSKINYFISNPPVNPGVITGHTATCLVCINGGISGMKLGLHSDWESLLSMVNGYDLSSNAMKDSLVNQGNRLPDEILLDAIIKKEEEGDSPFFSDVQLRDILVANAPNTYRVIKVARERVPTLSGDVLPQIEAAQDSPATARLDTMNAIYALEHDKQIIYNSFIRFALEDSNDIIIAHVIDSLLFETDIESKVKLVEMYLVADSLVAAGSVLSSLKLYNEELRQFSKLMKIYLELREEDKDWPDADGGVIEQLWNIVDTRTKASVKAQNILSLLLDTTFAELIEEIEVGGSPKTSNLQAGKPKDESSAQTESLIKVYPNPAKDEIIVELPVSESDWQLKITGIVGINNIQKRISANTIKHIISVKELLDGLFIYEIKNSQGTQANGKIVIIK